MLCNKEDGTVDAAGGYIAKLQSTEFLFLIEVFRTIFPHTEMLFSILQTKRFDISYCNSKVQDVKETMQQLRNDESFDHIWQQAFVTNDESELPRKKRKVDDTADKIAYGRLFFEIVNHILQEFLPGLSHCVNYVLWSYSIQKNLFSILKSFLEQPLPLLSMFMGVTLIM